MVFPKPELFLKFYSFHTGFLDPVMKMLTFLGNGIAAAIVVIHPVFQQAAGRVFHYYFYRHVWDSSSQLLKILFFQIITGL